LRGINILIWSALSIYFCRIQINGDLKFHNLAAQFTEYDTQASFMVQLLAWTSYSSLSIST
jgi:predicted oxidoreductase (fatty acid repression mutant protein)